MTDIKATNAVSSGVSIDPTTLRRLMALNNGPGVWHFTAWIALLVACGFGLHASTGTYLFIPAMLVYATVLTEPSYAISHESAHGTYVKSKGLNSAIFWFTSLIYGENPVHRYHAHMRHHNFTWINGMDAQISKNPLRIHTFLLEFSNLDHYWYNAKQMIKGSLGIHDTFVRSFVPTQELPKLQRASLAFFSTYAAMIAITWWYDGWDILLTYVVFPRLIGAFAMQTFVFNQHAEMEADQHDIRKSCRSFDTNWLGRFLGCDMNRHVEHHLYPKIPFHALDDLKTELGDQLPTPSNGMIATDIAIFASVWRRTYGREQTPASSVT